jgi:DTW domain-containing protein
MSWRKSGPHRCEECRLWRPLCICSLIPKFDLNTKVVILIHNRETKRTSNTGRLAHLILTNSEMRVRGKLDTPLKTADLVSPGRRSLLLYPTDDAVELNEDFIGSSAEPITLIVPDGSWRQASKVPHRETGLAVVPRVKLSLGRSTEYKLRMESKPNGLATFEAIARALGIIEGPHIQSKMESIFKIMVERTLWARARIPANQCTGGIPPEAISNEISQKS